MTEVFLWLLPYFILAIIAGTLSGTVSTIIFHRNFSNLVGGLSHFFLGPITLTFYLKYIFNISINPYLFSAVLASIIMLLIPLNENGEIKQPQHINILWSFGMALGIYFVYSTPNISGFDLFFFGNILTITRSNLYTLVILTLCILLFFTLFHTKISYVGLDDAFLRVKRIPTMLFHKIQILIVTYSIILLLQILGILLLLTIVSLPSVIASIYARSYKALLAHSIFISIISLLFSIWMSYLINVPVSTFAALIICMLFFASRFLAILIKKIRKIL